MAYGDFTLFSPRESAYQEPGQFESSMKAEATRKASYMSEMDKFYAQLEESERQFDVKAELERGSQALQGRGLDIEQELGRGNLELGRGELTESGRQFDIGIASQQEQFTGELGFNMKKLEQTLGIESARLLEEGRQFDITTGLEARKLGSLQGLNAAQIEALGAQSKASELTGTLGIFGLLLKGGQFAFGSEQGGGLGIGYEDIEKLFSAGDEIPEVDVPELEFPEFELPEFKFDDTDTDWLSDFTSD